MAGQLFLSLVTFLFAFLSLLLLLLFSKPQEQKNPPLQLLQSFILSIKEAFSWIFMYDKLVLELLGLSIGVFKIHFGGHFQGVLKL